MLRKFLGSFNATHFTIMFMGLLLVPGAVVAAVKYQAVAVVDPSTGTVSRIDSGRRLYVYDPIAGYRNNPANFVNITVSNNGNRCESQAAYTVPSGKALVITGINGFVSYYNDPISGFYIYKSTTCTGTLLTSYFSSVNNSSLKRAPISTDIGSGIVIPGGGSFSVYSIYNFGYTSLQGYLVPASAIPAASSQDAAAEGKEVTSAEVAAKDRRSR